jgi:hypothetical protein
MNIDDEDDDENDDDDDNENVDNDDNENDDNNVASHLEYRDAGCKIT